MFLVLEDRLVCTAAGGGSWRSLENALPWGPWSWLVFQGDVHDVVNGPLVFPQFAQGVPHHTKEAEFCTEACLLTLVDYY